MLTNEISRITHKVRRAPVRGLLIFILVLSSYSSSIVFGFDQTRLNFDPLQQGLISNRQFTSVLFGVSSRQEWLAQFGTNSEARAFLNSTKASVDTDFQGDVAAYLSCLDSASRVADLLRSARDQPWFTSLTLTAQPAFSSSLDLDWKSPGYLQNFLGRVCKTPFWYVLLQFDQLGRAASGLARDELQSRKLDREFRLRINADQTVPSSARPSTQVRYLNTEGDMAFANDSDEIAALLRIARSQAGPLDGLQSEKDSLMDRGSGGLVVLLRELGADSSAAIAYLLTVAKAFDRQLPKIAKEKRLFASFEDLAQNMLIAKNLGSATGENLGAYLGDTGHIVIIKPLHFWELAYYATIIKQKGVPHAEQLLNRSLRLRRAASLLLKEDFRPDDLRHIRLLRFLTTIDVPLQTIESMFEHIGAIAPSIGVMYQASHRTALDVSTEEGLKTIIGWLEKLSNDRLSWEECGLILEVAGHLMNLTTDQRLSEEEAYQKARLLHIEMVKRGWNSYDSFDLARISTSIDNPRVLTDLIATLAVKLGVSIEGINFTILGDVINEYKDQSDRSYFVAIACYQYLIAEVSSYRGVVADLDKALEPLPPIDLASPEAFLAFLYWRTSTSKDDLFALCVWDALIAQGINTLVAFSEAQKIHREILQTEVELPKPKLPRLAEIWQVKEEAGMDDILAIRVALLVNYPVDKRTLINAAARTAAYRAFDFYDYIIFREYVDLQHEGLSDRTMLHDVLPFLVEIYGIASKTGIQLDLHGSHAERDFQALEYWAQVVKIVEPFERKKGHSEHDVIERLHIIFASNKEYFYETASKNDRLRMLLLGKSPRTGHVPGRVSRGRSPSPK